MLFEQTFFFTRLEKKKNSLLNVMNIHKQVKNDDSNLVSERGCRDQRGEFKQGKKELSRRK